MLGRPILFAALCLLAGRALKAATPTCFQAHESGLMTDFGGPGGMASNGSYLFVSDPIHSQVIKFDLALNRVAVWGSLGSGPGQLNYPSGVAVQGPSLWVTDSGNGRVVEYDLNGNVVDSWPSIRNGEQLVSNGTYIFQSDWNYHQIYKYDMAGNSLAAWGSYGAGPGQLASPHGMAIVANELYVADYHNDRIVKYDFNGNTLAYWGVSGTAPGQLSGPAGVATDGTSLFVAESNNDRVSVFDLNGALITTMTETCYSSLPRVGKTLQPSWMAADTGNVFVGLNSGPVRFSACSGPIQACPTFDVGPPTAAPEPERVLADRGKVGPVPVVVGEELCVRMDRTGYDSIKLRLLNSAGQVVSTIAGDADAQPCLETGSLAPGIYYAHLSVLSKGALSHVVRKIAVVR